MSTAENLRTLLEPLGVYRWENTFQWGELKSEGEVLDKVAAELEHTWQEMNPATAQEEGLRDLQAMLGLAPQAADEDDLRQALAALLRIGGDSFTLAAMNDTLRGCGLPAQVQETDDPQELVVTFPGIGGVPAGFFEMRRILESILPCQVQITYHFLAVTWGEIARRFPTWAIFEKNVESWAALTSQSLFGG